MDISIVIPAFNEEKKIGRDVEVAAAFVDEESIPGEVIVVDDGSTDKTAEEAEKAFGPIHILCNNAGVNIICPLD